MQYYMFNKPRGCVTARTDGLHKTVMDYFPEELRCTLHPVGRLDLDTEGLLLITDDGMFDHRLMEPEFHIEKTYFFYAFGRLDYTAVKAFEQGVIIQKNGRPTRPARLNILNYTAVADIAEYLPAEKREGYMKNPKGEVTAAELTITEGRNHQVKLMVKSARCTVAYLKRISVGGVTLDNNLAAGEYRPLTADELKMLTQRTK